ncbi:MAG: UDP-N-acetylmuramoyl-tripeptide--D-alanyl-D-alanine ligase [Deltaproteobacteria bacterium]
MTPWPYFTGSELAQATGGTWSGGAPASATGISTDTRSIPAGSAFVALRGERFDAHDFLTDAARAGAACAVVARDRTASDPPGLPLLAVDDTLRALGGIARWHRLRHAIPVVGVTGSNGKTTTREMIAAILATRGPVWKTEGNLNNEVGVPLTLLGLRPEHQAAVIEMGMSARGEIARLAAIAEPWVGVVTNALPAHLATLGSLDAVADAKGELYRGLPADGIAVANADDPRMLHRARKSGRRLLTFSGGGDPKADVVVLGLLGQDALGMRFRLGIGTKEVEVGLPLVGEHNAGNAAAAAAAALALGCTDREIVRGLAGVRTVGRRLRVERLPSGVLLVDDCYNANPASMRAALRTVRQLAGAGRALAALGDMLELGPTEEELHRELGRDAAAAGLASLATFGPRARHTREAAVAAGMAEAEAFHTEDPQALAAFLRERLRPGDTLLVKGSRGMKLERLVEALR